MSIWLELIRSSIGKKYIMAITGFLLFIFVIGHLLGNLQIFLGPEVINSYAEKLRSMPQLLWAARVGLLIVVALHIWMAASLTIENRRARPEPYQLKTPIQATYSARTIRVSGVIILAFVIYHLLHFTFLVIDPEYATWQDAEGRPHVYKMMVAGFSNVWISGFYLLAMLLLCLHLSHGLMSMFQSVGLRNTLWAGFLKQLARTVAALIFLGYASIPVAVLSNLIE